MGGLFSFLWTGLGCVSLFGFFLQIHRSNVSCAISDDLRVRTTDPDLIVKIVMLLL
jgi:hypothetical protein